MYIIIYGIIVYFKRDYPKYLILEIGADKKGDIESICNYIKLDIGVVTAFAKYPVHIENFANRDELIREKRYMIESIKNGGALIYNSGCIDSAKMLQDAYKENTLHKNILQYSYGINIGDVFVKNIINNIDNKNVEARLFIKHINTENNNFVEDYNITLNGVLGDAAILTTLPGLIITQLLGFDIQRSILAMKDMKRPPGRMRVLDGQYGTTIIDDSYNSSPVAVQNGLNVLREIKSKDKYKNIIIILGDMLELGEMSLSAHSEIGEIIGKSGIDKLVTVGIRSRDIRLSAINNGLLEKNTLEYISSIEAGRNIINMIANGVLPHNSVIYIKGSQSIRMERVVKMLLNKDLDPSQYLVRQDRE
ncbi:MAG: cyanophycin synthetase [Cyanobium sp. MAG06]|nr:cyanophycin synthetase [Cyanobium sp. MAG06]